MALFCLLWALHSVELCSACYGHDSDMDRHWLLWLPLPVIGFMTQSSNAVPVMGKSQFCLGLSMFLSFCYQSLALCGLSCPALIMLFPGRVLTCSSFTELCHLHCSCPSSHAGVRLSTLVISQYVQRPRAETASSSLAKHPGARQVGLNRVQVPESIQVLKSMGSGAQCFLPARRLHYIYPLRGVSYPEGEIYVCS